MPKFLAQCNYVGEGMKGLLREGGSSRRAVVEKLVESVGGKVEAFYYAFGETDLFVIAELPDNVSMTAVALMVAASGAIAIKTTVLLTPEEVDEAAKKTPVYRPPGAYVGLPIVLPRLGSIALPPNSMFWSVPVRTARRSARHRNHSLAANRHWTHSFAVTRTWNMSNFADLVRANPLDL
jgi:uncharacterized protein with GYD domain